LRVGVLKCLLLHDAFLPFFFFSDHCAILELGYKKSGKIFYSELVRSQTFWINDFLLYIQTGCNVVRKLDYVCLKKVAVIFWK
jgi:hypothetical protein